MPDYSSSKGPSTAASVQVLGAARGRLFAQPLDYFEVEGQESKASFQQVYATYQSVTKRERGQISASKREPVSSVLQRVSHASWPQ